MFKTISRTHPDIRFYRDGKIEISMRAAERMNISTESISFQVDEEDNLYVLKDKTGLQQNGHRYRYYCKQTTDNVFNMVQADSSSYKIGFRIGVADDGVHYPIITRRILY